jgi:hypothetical protein
MSIAGVSGVILGLGLIVLAADLQAEPIRPTKLPFSQGLTFDSLDAYLAHLERLGTMDITWYNLRPDGTYEVVRRRAPSTPAIILSRQDLLDRFGFVE